MALLDLERLQYFYNKIKALYVRTINNIAPVNGNVTITNVATADNLTSPDGQAIYGEYIYRTSGGSVDLSSGEAELVYIDGNIDIVGRVEENMTITTTNNLTAAVDMDTWRASQYGAATGTYVFSYTKSTETWNPHSPSTDGITVTGLTYDSVTATVDGSITAASVNESTWKGRVGSAGTYIFIYDGIDWTLNNNDVDLSNYGITYTGTAVADDMITVVYEIGTSDSTVTVDYTKPARGTIYVANPRKFSATGFNQFNKANGSGMWQQNYTINGGKVVTGSYYMCYVRAVGGVTNGYVAYSPGNHIKDIAWCATTPVLNSDVSQASKSVTSSLASIPFDTDGYVVVIVDNIDDLQVHPQWSGSANTDTANYVDPSEITLPLTGNTSSDGSGSIVDLPLKLYGMPRLGNVADRMNLDAGTYIQAIGRYAFSSENLATVQALGVVYDYDATNIFYVLPESITYYITVDPMYTVNDFGTEEFTNTTVPVYAQNLYGQNLRDKLRNNVLTISAQTPALTNAQKAVVRNSLGAGALHGYIANLNTTKTYSNSKITSDMRVCNAVFGTPANVTSDITWTTSNGSVTFSGTLSGATTIDFDIIPIVT